MCKHKVSFILWGFVTFLIKSSSPDDCDISTDGGPTTPHPTCDGDHCVALQSGCQKAHPVQTVATLLETVINSALLKKAFIKATHTQENLLPVNMDIWAPGEDFDVYNSFDLSTTKTLGGSDLSERAQSRTL